MFLKRNGLSVCAKYAYPPNSLSFCGPNKTSDLLGYVTRGSVDQGLGDMLNRFQTLSPYLKLISTANLVKDPYDLKVVEAYWIGNNYLDKVRGKRYYNFIVDDIKLKKYLKAPNLDLVNNLPNGYPNHNFHVLNIFLHTGIEKESYTLPVIDKCRISWGQVLSKTEYNSQDNQYKYIVKTKPLMTTGSQLVFGPPIVKTVSSKLPFYKVGQDVSIHWDTICEVLDEVKLRNLDKYSQVAIAFANKILY
ncbi:DUF6390 family protein [Patescibacteria group bacterium]